MGMYCSTCGKKFDNDSQKFCPNCGALRATSAQSEETGDALLSLLSTLLESGDEDSRTLAGQAMKELGMQAVPYSTDAQEAFDVLPTRGETRTVRPAIAREGKVLRRGLAVMHGQS